MQVESALLFETPEEMCARVYRTLRPRSPVPAVAVRFHPFANANSDVRLAEGRIEVRVTDLLADAPAYVLESLLTILLCKLLRRPVPAEFQQRYRRYLNAGDVRRRLHAIRRERGRKHVAAPDGAHRDLGQLYDELERRYFPGGLARPTLAWSRQAARSSLGHYDPSHHAIVISRLLDSPEVPELALRYVLFHEMLHVQHPVRYGSTRRCVHTPEFRAAEKAFSELAEAKALLKRL